MNPQSIVQGILRHRIAVLIAIALVTVAAAFSATRVGFDSDIEVWFVEGDPSVAAYHEFLKRFDADEIAVIGLFDAERTGPDDLGVFEPATLQAIERLTEGARNVTHAYRVSSLATATVLESPGPLMIAVNPLFDTPPADVEAAAAVRTRALGSETLRGTLVSDDGGATAIVVEMDPAGNDFLSKVAFVEALRALIEAEVPEGVTWHLTGSPPLDEAFMRYSERDFTVLGPLAFLIVFLSTFLLFRRFSAALLCLSVVILATIWTFGLMGALGIDINLVSTSLVTLILAVGVADTVHVITDYYQTLMEGVEKEEAIVQSTSSLLAPCFFTSATTAAGFLSLLSGDLAPIKQFGWLAAVGVLLAFLLSVTFAPCMLSFVAPPGDAFIRGARDGWLSRVLRRLGQPTRRSSVRVLLASALLLCVSAWTLTHLEIGANVLNYFKPDDPVRASMIAVDEALGGATSFEFFIETEDGGLKEPAVLNRLQDLETSLEALTGVTRVMSVLDGLRESHKLLTGGEAKDSVLPDNRPLAAQLYLFLEGDADFRRQVQGDYSVGRMTAQVQLSQAHALMPKIPELKARLSKDYSDPALTVRATGYVSLMSEMELYLFSSQIRSLLLAFLVVTSMMVLLLRSLSLGLLSMIPNFLPIVLGLAFMVPAGFALDPGTVMIGSMALGLVVDDSVHYLVRLRRALADHPLPEAIGVAMHHTGRAIVLTSVILASGFAVLGLGSFIPNIAFGLVSAVVILMAVVADLVVLPAVLMILRPRLGVSDSPVSAPTSAE